MRAQLRAGEITRLQAAAIILILALGVGAGTVARVAHPHKHPAAGVTALAVTVADQLPTGPRGDLHATAPPAAPTTTLARSGTGTADASPLASSGTARSPQVRGPPAQAAV